MTQPANLAEAQDQQALAYELEAEEAATAEFVAALTAAVATILAAAALVAAGTIAVSVLQEVIHRTLGSIHPSMRGTLALAVRRGISLGREQGAAWVDVEVPFTPEVDATLVDAVNRIDPDAQAVLDEALRLADTLDLTQEDNVLTVTAKATSAGKGAQGQTRWASVRAVNQGISDAARAAGVRLLWRAERNACLKCLAYSGLTVDPPGLFPVGLTLGTGRSTLGGVPYPPLHRWCRCRVVPYGGPDATELGADEASGLQREAMRTVARGWSDYASQPERLRAADLLLQRGFRLPKTVLARAARDVARGSFSQRHRPRTTLNA